MNDIFINTLLSHFLSKSTCQACILVHEWKNNILQPFGVFIWQELFYTPREEQVTKFIKT